jgi:sugar lactone lactonase YvrE
MEIRHPDFVNYVDPDRALSKWRPDLISWKGPVWDPDAEMLIFSDILGNSLYRWQPETGPVPLKRHSYMANGNAFDRQGRLITCEHATSRLSRTDLRSGGYEVLLSHFDVPCAEQSQRRRGQKRRRNLFHRSHLRTQRRIRCAAGTRAAVLAAFTVLLSMKTF